MPSSTASGKNRPINVANFSVENGAGDPFTVVKGRLVGHDGFIVPNNFEEFYERYPAHVRNWVRKHVSRSTPNEDVEDWTQDLLIHLKFLPATSKHRTAGKEDIVQTFDPKKHHGANAARFFNYVNLCLANKFRAMHSKRIKNPICRPGNSPFQWEWEDGNQTADESWHAHSEYLRKRCNRQERQRSANHLLSEFYEFVKREDPSVLPTLQAVAVAGMSAAAVLGTTQHEVCRTWSRLRILGRCFQNGEPVPRAPRRYTRRTTTRITIRVR